MALSKRKTKPRPTHSILTQVAVGLEDWSPPPSRILRIASQVAEGRLFRSEFCVSVEAAAAIIAIAGKADDQSLSAVVATLLVEGIRLFRRAELGYPIDHRDLWPEGRDSAPAWPIPLRAVLDPVSAAIVRSMITYTHLGKKHLLRVALDRALAARKEKASS